MNLKTDDDPGERKASLLGNMISVMAPLLPWIVAIVSVVWWGSTLQNKIDVLNANEVAHFTLLLSQIEALRQSDMAQQHETEQITLRRDAEVNILRQQLNQHLSDDLRRASK